MPPKATFTSGAYPRAPDVCEVDVDQAWLDDDVRDTHDALRTRAATTPEAATPPVTAPIIAASKAREVRGGETGVRQAKRADDHWLTNYIINQPTN